MGRKRKGFQWTADPDDPDRIEPVNREPRAVLKGRLDEIQHLANDIAALPAADRKELPLSAPILEELDALAQTGPSPARKRQLNYVKRLMIDVDVDHVRAAMQGDTERADRLRQADRWRNRMMDQGDEALTAFVDAYPAADRPRLRALMRRATDGGGSRAARQLFDALVATMEEGGQPE